MDTHLERLMTGRAFPAGAIRGARPSTWPYTMAATNFDGTITRE